MGTVDLLIGMDFADALLTCTSFLVMLENSLERETALDYMSCESLPLKRTNPLKSIQLKLELLMLSKT